MFNLILDVVVPEIPQTCLWGFICANETFIAIYGVIFTIVISLGVYIYGLQDKSERITLIKGTDIEGVITNCLMFFAISFVLIPSPFYEFVNFMLALCLLLNIFNAFKVIFKFNESFASGEMAVRKFKEGVISEKLKQFENLKIKNDLLSQQLTEKKGKEIERFLLDENDNTYDFIRSRSSGYITDIDLGILFIKDIKEDLLETDRALLKNVEYYIPNGIRHGAPIEIDAVILGVKKKGEQKIDEDRLRALRSFVSISEEYENPTSYIEAEARSYYPEMISLIKIEDAKSLELKLKEFSGLVNHFTNKADSYIDIIQFTNDDIIFPLQKYAFKQGNIDCIRKVVSFSLGYIYEALKNKSIQTFNIFLRNLGYAFYESFSLKKKERIEFREIYFRWLKEIAKYSIKPRLKKNEDYAEYAVKFLLNINGWLKTAFDKKDILAFDQMLVLLNESFSRQNHEYAEDSISSEIILTKKAIIFGFTAWVYKYYGTRKNELFYKSVLDKLLVATNKDLVYSRGDQQDHLNYYLSVYLKAIDLSEGKGSLGWDSWGMVEGVVYTVTIRDDIKNLLVDRILDLVLKYPTLTIDIKDKNYDDSLARIKQGNGDFDPLVSKDKASYFSTRNLSDEQFSAVKVKFYEVFSQVSQKYETDVRNKLITQQIDDVKFDNFAKENFASYENSRTLYRIQKFPKAPEKKEGGFGYSTLLYKEQFVAETTVHYVGGDEFGEDLARSEDNKVLGAIYDKLPNVSPIEKSDIGKIVSSEDGLTAVVLWSDGYISIEDTNPEGFKPYWQETGSKESKGPYYQGSIKGIPVYIVYKLEKHKSYSDTIFMFKDGAFSIEEFEIERDEESIDPVNTKYAEDAANCLTLSITNLSDLEDVRKEIVENWIQKDHTNTFDKVEKISELKTRVAFKFYKGLSIDSLTLDTSKIKVFHVR